MVVAMDRSSPDQSRKVGAASFSAAFALLRSLLVTKSFIFYAANCLNLEPSRFKCHPSCVKMLTIIKVKDSDELSKSLCGCEKRDEAARSLRKVKKLAMFVLE